MESKVRLSTFSLILTLIVTGGLIAIVAYVFLNGEDRGIVAAFILLLALLSGGLYGPVSISVDDKNINVKSSLRKQKIPIDKIQSVELFQPPLGTMRIFASGGYMGYWGLFRGSIGRYVAYYGKASDCFLISMKDGGKYVLGCEHPSEMVAFINSKIR